MVPISMWLILLLILSGRSNNSIELPAQTLQTCKNQRDIYRLAQGAF